MSNDQFRVNANDAVFMSNMSNKPRYREICVGESNCVSIESCGDVSRALRELGIDDEDLVEFVTKAVGCGGAS